VKKFPFPRGISRLSQAGSRFVGCGGLTSVKVGRTGKVATGCFISAYLAKGQARKSDRLGVVYPAFDAEMQLDRALAPHSYSFILVARAFRSISAGVLVLISGRNDGISESAALGLLFPF
jgi:hypothetical protein